MTVKITKNNLTRLVREAINEQLNEMPRQMRPGSKGPTREEVIQMLEDAKFMLEDDDGDAVQPSWDDYFKAKRALESMTGGTLG